jgi:hypothetical protein
MASDNNLGETLLDCFTDCFTTKSPITSKRYSVFDGVVHELGDIALSNNRIADALTDVAVAIEHIAEAIEKNETS